MIATSEFLARRHRLLDQLKPNSVCLLPAAQLATRSHDTEFPFRQDSDFWYLTGFPEPDALLLLSNSDKHDNDLSVLFCLPKDKLAEIWHGRRIGPEAAVEQFGFDEAYELEHTAEALIEFVDGHEHLYFPQGHNAGCDELVFDTLKTLRKAPKQTKSAPAILVDIRPLLHEMRLFKSKTELAVMAKAGQISAAAHTRAMTFCQPGKFEYQLEAELHHEFLMQGARSPAYGTIVGSGDNACILHYTENADELKPGALVLIDAGAELHGYAADITRTFPVSGVFSQPQKHLYQLVLDAQLASMAFLKPGETLKRATDEAIRVITQGLLELGLLSGSLEENIKEQTYRAFFMHGLGHWLGLDVHDVGHYKVDGQDRTLQPGMVLTVEPGIYVAPDADVDPQWQGIGIRIEDNVVITDSGHDNLTSDVVKSIEEIESLMARR